MQPIVKNVGYYSPQYKPYKIKKQPSVSLSVLMPVYNEFYTVHKCIERILNVTSPYLSELELIIVDDGSTDGTKKILRQMASNHSKIIYIEHKKNQGKGAAIQTALNKASNDICIIQDADLEYNPDDYSKIIYPFIYENADAVLGSRFLVGNYSRVLYFRHAVSNRLLTYLVCLITDINYSDIETCYKAIRTRLFKSIPIYSNNFNLEPEICIKLAKRGASIFEVPISYSGRTKEEGKKITWKDGLGALWTILKYWFIDDIYKMDAYGSNILQSLTHAKNFSQWTADVIQPHIGNKVLEIGAGIGNITVKLIPRLKYIASDINIHYLDYLENFSLHKPYMQIKRIDLTKEKDFITYLNEFDTCICLNVLEHIEDDSAALRNIYKSLAPGGRAIILVPQGAWLYSTLDGVLGHYRRYSALQLKGIMESAGFRIEKVITSFNRFGVLAWFLNGKILRRKRFSKIQLKILNIFSWLFRLINPILPWKGLSTIIIGQKPFSVQ